MDRIPDRDERAWLIRNLRKLIERRGWRTFVSSPIIEPESAFFPELWSGTMRDAHVVLQRLLHYANLGSIRATLIYDVPDLAVDKNTAGWFAGIRDGRGLFGVRLEQLHDPEQAAGVLAHEVAHAYREHHKLQRRDEDVDAETLRDREELLTDLTTIYLGFGILTTNNTDRYRSSGDYYETRWSVAMAGYLPPNAMAYALALQASARGRRDEVRAIRKHLEPNQRASFDAAIEQFDRDDLDVLSALGLPAREQWPAVEQRPLPPLYEPAEDELYEPEEEDAAALATRNAGETIYRKRNDSGAWPAFFGLWIGGFVGFLATMSIAVDPSDAVVWAGTVTPGAILAFFFVRYARRYVCSACGETVPNDVAVCPGCGGNVGGTVTTKQLRRIVEEQLDRAAASMEFEECDECEPEQPCSRHRMTSEIEN